MPLTNRDELIKDLARLKPALGPAKGIVSELSHVWINEGVAYAYDGGFGIELVLRNDPELDCGVPGVTFMELLGTSALKEVKLEQKGAVLQIGLGKSSSKLATLETSRRVWGFPEKLSKGKSFEVGEDFVEALRKTLLIRAKVQTHVLHYGVLLQAGDAGLELYSTDIQTMARAVIPSNSKGVDPVILPHTFAEQIVSQTPAGVTLRVSPDCLIAAGEEVIFYSNILDGAGTDDLASIIARQEERHGDPLPIPAGIGSALNRAEILAGREAPIVTITAKGSLLLVEGDYGLGSLKEELKLEGKLPEVKFRVHVEHLRRILPYVENFSLTKDSMLLTGEPGFTYVIAAL